MFLLLFSLASSARWAVLMAGSNDWYNYRHQADIATIYDLLINRSFPADHIITIAYNDIPSDSKNPYRNKLFHNVDHHNMYHGASHIDYTGGKVTAQSFYDVLTGNKTAGKVLESTAEDDVFIYYDNHGADGILGVPDGVLEYITFERLQECVNTMHKKGMYKRLLFMVEACESGHLPGFIKAPNAVVITAAKYSESSMGSIFDPDVDNYLSNEFTFAAIDLINQTDLKISEFYDKLVKGTPSSTPQIGGGGYEALKDTYISTWFGEYKNEPKNVLAKPRPKIVEKMSQREVLRHLLKKRGDLHSLKKLHALDANRAKIEKKLKDIAYLLNIDDLNKVENPTKENWSCFFKALEAFTKKNGNLHQDDMGLTRKLLDMCAVRSEENVIKAVHVI